MASIEEQFETAIAERDIAAAVVAASDSNGQLYRLHDQIRRLT